jgi:hypothetical protein
LNKNLLKSQEKHKKTSKIMTNIEQIIREIRQMDYQDLGRIQYELDCRVALLDKYEDMRRAELEDMYRDQEDYEYPQF